MSNATGTAIIAIFNAPNDHANESIAAHSEGVEPLSAEFRRSRIGADVPGSSDSELVRVLEDLIELLIEKTGHGDRSSGRRTP